MARYVPGREGTKRWLARASHRGRTYHLGWFRSERDAVSAEEDWWADPANVPYEAWVRRLVRYKTRPGLPKSVLRRTLAQFG